MKNFLQGIWMPALGTFSSLGFKTISDKTLSSDIIDTAADIVNIANPDKTLFQYFLIGVVGAAGGLALKIIWGCIKKFFPKLKNIDK